MRIKIPDKVAHIISRLEEKGFEAYAVGGCVRDCILGREPEDWDITTSAKPEQIKQVFAKTVDTGIQHGTVTVLIERESFEVTTYRIDGEYEDGRHPKKIEYTDDLTEDLKRRDFTINAMAYNPGGGIVDTFDGIGDLEKRVIRCVGRAEERFEEDALRILRAVRFSAQLGFRIEEETQQAIRQLAGNLQKISAERIQAEIVKLLMSERPEKWQEVYEYGICDVILPQYCRELTTDERNEIVIALAKSEQQRELRLAVLLSKFSSEQAKKILRQLKFDNAAVQTVEKLVKWNRERLEPEITAVRKFMAVTGEELFALLLKLKEVSLASQSGKEKELYQLEQIRDLSERIIRQGDCISLKTLAISGNDLIAAGVGPGKELGSILKRIFQMVLEEPANNNKAYLMKQVKKHVTKDRAMD